MRKACFAWKSKRGEAGVERVGEGVPDIQAEATSVGTGDTGDTPRVIKGREP